MVSEKIESIVSRLAPEKARIVRLHDEAFGAHATFDAARQTLRMGLESVSLRYYSYSNPHFVTVEDRTKNIRNKPVVAQSTYASRMFFDAIKSQGLEKKNSSNVIYNTLEQLAASYEAYMAITEKFAQEWNLTPEQLQFFRVLVENHYNTVNKDIKRKWGESRYTLPVYAAQLATYDFTLEVATSLISRITPLEEAASFKGAPAEWIQEWLKS